MLKLSLMIIIHVNIISTNTSDKKSTNLSERHVPRSSLHTHSQQQTGEINNNKLMHQYMYREKKLCIIFFK